jgi:ADP-ribosylglycohydrolase
MPSEKVFGEESLMKTYIHQRILPETTLDFTDDTIMSIAVFNSLRKWEQIDQRFLAEEFTKIIIWI